MEQENSNDGLTYRPLKTIEQDFRDVLSKHQYVNVVEEYPLAPVSAFLIPANVNENPVVDFYRNRKDLNANGVNNPSLHQCFVEIKKVCRNDEEAYEILDLFMLTLHQSNGFDIAFPLLKIQQADSQVSYNEIQISSKVEKFISNLKISGNNIILESNRQAKIFTIHPDYNQIDLGNLNIKTVYQFDPVRKKIHIHGPMIDFEPIQLQNVDGSNDPYNLFLEKASLTAKSHIKNIFETMKDHSFFETYPKMVATGDYAMANTSFSQYSNIQAFEFIAPDANVMQDAEPIDSSIKYYSIVENTQGRSKKQPFHQEVVPENIDPSIKEKVEELSKQHRRWADKFIYKGIELSTEVSIRPLSNQMKHINISTNLVKTNHKGGKKIIGTIIHELIFDKPDPEIHVFKELFKTVVLSEAYSSGLPKHLKISTKPRNWENIQLSLNKNNYFRLKNIKKIVQEEETLRNYHSNITHPISDGDYETQMEQATFSPQTSGNTPRASILPSIPNDAPESLTEQTVAMPPQNPDDSQSVPPTPPPTPRASGPEPEPQPQPQRPTPQPEKPACLEPLPSSSEKTTTLSPRQKLFAGSLSFAGGLASAYLLNQAVVSVSSRVAVGFYGVTWIHAASLVLIGMVLHRLLEWALKSASETKHQAEACCST